MKILVTGVAGFIGSRLMHTLALQGHSVVGIDNINDYYDVRVKYGRLKVCGIEQENNEFEFGKRIQSSLLPQCCFIRMAINDRAAMEQLFEKEKFDKVVNMAAQAGVRYSITNPYAYLESNLVGFMNVLECCRHHKIKHLVFASSSSVYGLNEKTPYCESDQVDEPVSLYAATKKSNELMAHSYAKLYNLRVSGLRYFTVYGPWGRPDMAPMLFAKAISNGEPIKVFNNGDMMRDFTYIDDIVEGTILVLDQAPASENCTDFVPYQVYNIGRSSPVFLKDFIKALESAMGVNAKKVYLPMQQGDVHQTYADITKLQEKTGYRPKIDLHNGISKFVKWFESEENPVRQ
ncbi:NAD-dependent epimerase/dehydratase family protein [Dysgonomonas sp.]